MRDKKKFYVPKHIKNPLPGDYEVTLNWGDKVYVEKNEFEKKTSKFFKNYLVVADHEEDNHDYSRDYLAFEALEDGTFSFSGNGILYSLDNGITWINLSTNSSTQVVNKNKLILWKGNLVPLPYAGIGRFSATGNFNVKGNIMSLLYGDDFVGQTDLKTQYFGGLDIFRENTHLINSKDLVLSATTLTPSCYQYMFKNCTALTTTPELPATTLAERCYDSMFQGCTSLTTAPELPATTLAANCYASMFYGCTNLTTAPELSATTLANYCYASMFYDCTNLTTAPQLPATTLTNYCYSIMFSECTSLTIAPELPATILADHCYSAMFYNCTNLNNITCLAIDKSAPYCLYNWVKDISTSGIFTKAESSTWVTGTDGIPTGWTIQTV